MEKGLSIYVILGLSVWSLLVTVVAGYFYTQYAMYQSEYEDLADRLNSLADQIGNFSGAMKQLGDSIQNLSGALDSQAHNYSGMMRQLGEDIEDISNVLESIPLEASILISYGNKTRVWHNDTVLPLGSTAFDAINATAEDISFTDYGGDLGILVTSINGVANNDTHGWFYWYWEAATAQWKSPSYSCAKFILHIGDIIAFSYASYLEWPPSPPT